MRKLPTNTKKAKRYRWTVQPTDQPINIAGYKVACTRPKRFNLGVYKNAG